MNGHAIDKMNGYATEKMNGHAADKVNGYNDRANARGGKMSNHPLMNGHAPKLSGGTMNGAALDSELDNFKKSHRMDLGTPKITKVAVKI